jgi:hypothetical protein
MSFERWMQDVDLRVLRALGIGVADLPDRNFWDAWDADVTAAEMAAILILDPFHDNLGEW